MLTSSCQKHDDDSSVKVDSPLDVESDDEEFVSDPYVRQHLAPYDVKENALFEIVKEKVCRAAQSVLFKIDCMVFHVCIICIG